LPWKGEGARIPFEKIYSRRARGDLSATNLDFYRTIRQNEYLHPDDFIPLLERFLAVSQGGEAGQRWS